MEDEGEPRGNNALANSLFSPWNDCGY